MRVRSQKPTKILGIFGIFLKLKVLWYSKPPDIKFDITFVYQMCITFVSDLFLTC